MINKVIIACITFFLISCGTGNSGSGLALLIDSSTDTTISIEDTYFTDDDIRHFALFQEIGDITEDIQITLSNNATINQIQVAVEEIRSNSNASSLETFNNTTLLSFDTKNWVDVTKDLTRFSMFQTDGNKTIRFTLNFYKQDGIIFNSARKGYEEIVVVFYFVIDNTNPTLDSFTATTDILPVIEKVDFSLTFSEALKQQLSAVNILMNVDGTREIVWNTHNKVVNISLYPQLGAREKNLEVSIDTIIEDLAGNTTILSQRLYDLDVIAPEIINIESEIIENTTHLYITYSFSEEISPSSVKRNSLDISIGKVVDVEHMGDRVRFRVELPVNPDFINYSLKEYKDIAGNIGAADGNHEIIFLPYIKGISEIKEVAIKTYEFTLYFSEEISSDSFTIADISYDSDRLSLTLDKEAGDIEEATVTITYKGEDTSETTMGVGVGKFSNYKGANDRIWNEKIDPLAPNIVEIIGIRDISQDSNGEFTVSLKFSENIQWRDVNLDLSGLVKKSAGINIISTTYDDKSYEATFDFEVIENTEGTVTFDVKDGSYKDFSGNNNKETIPFPQVMKVDVKSPSANIEAIKFVEEKNGKLYYSLKVNFSEEVEEVSFNKSLDITGDITENNFDFFGTSGIYTIEVDGTGEVGLVIRDGDYRDVLGNYNKEINGAIHIREQFNENPFITGIVPLIDIDQEKFQLKLTFSHPIEVATFKVDDILSTNTNILSHSITFGGNRRDATIDLIVLDDSIGEVTVNVAYGIYESIEGETNEEALSFPQHFSFDRVKPFIKALPLQFITTANVAGDKFPVNITFNEPIRTQEFEKLDLSTVFSTAGDITAESIIFSSSSDATVYFQVPANLEKMVSIQAIDSRYKDIVGNENVEKYSIDINIDLKAPFVKQKIVPSHSLYNKNNLLANESVEVALHFSEPIQQNTLKMTEIVTTLLSMSQINPSIVFHAEGKDATAGFVITEALEGSIVMHVSEGIYADILGNGNEEQLSPQDLTAIIDIDTQSPSTRLGGVSPIITVENFSLSLLFSEAIERSTLTTAEIVKVSAGINVVLNIAADNQSASLNFTIPSGIVGTVSVDIADRVYEDLAGNENEETSPIKEVIHIDRQFPFVSSIEENNVGNTLEVILNLSEEIETGSFPSLADIVSVEGTLLLTDIVMTLDVSAVELAINVGGKTGSVTIDIADGSYQDKSANDNKETVFPHKIEIDDTPPYIVSTELTSQETINKNDIGNISFELIFSEEISADTISLDNIFTIPVTITGALFVTEDVGKLVLTIPDGIEETVTLDVKNGTYKDLAGNTNVETLSNLEGEIRVDTQSPSTTIGVVPSSFSDAVLPVELTLSESINANTLTAAAIMSVNGDILAELVFTDENRKATLFLRRSGFAEVTVTINIANGYYEDEAGNKNEEVSPIQRVVTFQTLQLDELIANNECDKVLFDEGEGTQNDPYKISNICQLQNIAEDTMTKLYYTDLLSSHYQLTKNINATVTQPWNNGAGFNPIGDYNTIAIGDYSNSFDGTFDGGGFTLSNLTINRADDNYIGLFGYNNKGTIKDITLDSVNITGKGNVGGLVGYSLIGTIENNSVSGSISGNVKVGGLVGGMLGGTIENSNASGNVSGITNIGGFVGNINFGTILRSNASGNVSGSTNIGGFVGDINFGLIRNSSSSGNVEGTGSAVGGFIGRANSGFYMNDTWCQPTTNTLTQAVGNGSVTGITTYENCKIVATANDLQNITTNLNGNYILTNDIDLSVINNFEPIGDGSNAFDGIFDGGGFTLSNLTIHRADDDYIGVFGYNTGTIKDITLDSVDITGEDDVGGLVGYNDNGTIENSSSSGSISGSLSVGGLVGQNQGVIDDSSAAGSVNGTDGVGGLVGWNNSFNGTIENSSASGSVSGNDNVGGLVGQNQATIKNSSASSTVSGNDFIGGLVGYGFSGTIENASSSGSINGNDNVGGFVGFNNGNINYSSSSSSVSGTNNIGGFVGYHNGGSYDEDTWCKPSGADSLLQVTGFGGDSNGDIVGITEVDANCQ